MRDIKRIEEIVVNALTEANRTHDELGVRGLEEIEKNRFGDVALRVDVEAEESVIDVLREEGLPIRIISEEHGTLDLVKDPIYLGLLDGIDGTRVYKEARGRGRYGTMFGILSNLDPRYSDYLASGVVEHSTKRLFFASKDGGSFLMGRRKTLPIYCSGTTQLDPQTRIYVDEMLPFNVETFSENLQEFEISCLKASCVHYIDLASGNSDLVLECTRKGNLEIAIAYGLINESGGVMVSSDGIDLGERMYLEFGQDEQLPVITASTGQLAKKLIKRISLSVKK